MTTLRFDLRGQLKPGLELLLSFKSRVKAKNTFLCGNTCSDTTRPSSGSSSPWSPSATTRSSSSSSAGCCRRSRRSWSSPPRQSVRGTSSVGGIGGREMGSCQGCRWTAELISYRRWNSVSAPWLSLIVFVLGKKFYAFTNFTFSRVQTSLRLAIREFHLV